MQVSGLCVHAFSVLLTPPGATCEKEINSFEKVVAIMSVICWKLDFSGPL
jgi:hypothetical protein